MSIREISFPSANGRDTIKAWAYTPLGKPRAVIQLIHGFRASTPGRYLHMISQIPRPRASSSHADEHIGHGQDRLRQPAQWGDPHSGGY